MGTHDLAVRIAELSMAYGPDLIARIEEELMKTEEGNTVAWQKGKGTKADANWSRTAAVLWRALTDPDCEWSHEGFAKALVDWNEIDAEELARCILAELKRRKS